MSTTTVTVSPRRAHGPANPATLAGNLKSEWIKLTTVRSTIWTLIILAVVTLGLTALTGMEYLKEMGSRSGTTGSSDAWRSSIVGTALLPMSMTCLAVAVLGVLFSAGEYGTGSIRSTMTATPRRLPMLWAKTIVLGLTTFVFGFIVSLGSVSIISALYTTRPMPEGVDPESLAVDPVVVGAVCGAAGFLALTAIFALAIGFVVRNVAAAIAIVVGIFFVIPITIGLLNNSVNWLKDIAVYQFTESGKFMHSIPDGDPLPNTLEPWQGTLVVLTWTVVSVAIAAVLLKSKDA